MTEPSPAERQTRHFALVPAAGAGLRLGADRPKQYLPLGNATVLEQTVLKLLACEWFERVLVVVAPGDPVAATLAVLRHPRCQCLPVGGATRRDSVLGGLSALSAQCGAQPTDWVWVHDAARPGVSRTELDALKAALHPGEAGALLAAPIADTLKRHDADGRLSTVDRSGLYAAQTPQVFAFGPLQQALLDCPQATDESSAIEAAGGRPRLVPGGRDNFKVTTMDDLLAMRRAFEPVLPRVGQGWDVHALVPGRPLIVGGVRIPHTHGLLGHSDADVLLHAVIDALLGAASLGDIGRHFPDTDPRFRGADSRTLLRTAVERVREAGWQPAQLDSTVIAERPRLAPHLPAMVQHLSQDLSLPVTAVNVKAKTSERLGYAGRGEGISAQAVVVLAPLR